MILEVSIDLSAGLDHCFAYHQRPGALERFLPPWESIKIVRSDDSLEPGSEVWLRGRLFGIPMTWRARHERLESPKMFADRMLEGPFPEWFHEHHFEALDDHRTRLVDRVEYRLPGGFLGAKLGASYVERKLQAMFEYRHRLLGEDLAFGKAITAILENPVAPQTIAVSGSHGLIGRRIVSLLSVLGHQVIRLERPRASSMNNRDATAVKTQLATNYPRSILWEPRSGLDCPELLEGIDAVIHLAGQGIGDRRWSNATKKDLVHSRVDATAILARQLASLKAPPKAFVSASGIGIYGDRGAERLEESQVAGHDFLGELASKWERASNVLHAVGTRVCYGRLGIVLTPRGGALAKMLPIFRFGLGGRLGSGAQYWSWIDLDDAASAFIWTALHPDCQGPYHLVSNSITNQEFTRILGRVLGRPTVLPVPAFVLRTFLGEMADGLLLNSGRADGDRLRQTGFSFRQTDLEMAFRAMFGVRLSQNVVS